MYFKKTEWAKPYSMEIDEIDGQFQVLVESSSDSKNRHAIRWNLNSTQIKPLVSRLFKPISNLLYSLILVMLCQAPILDCIMVFYHYFLI